MGLNVGAAELVRCRALTSTPNFVDVTGTITGTINATYNPQFLGQFGHMAYADAQPLDVGVPTTGDQLAICFHHTPVAIDTAIVGATPFAQGAQAQAQEQQVLTAAKASVSTRKEQYVKPTVEVSESL